MNVVVVGSGVAGSLAARSLTDRGHRVVVLDKGFAPGGRLATRRIGPATFDVGAQFLTAKDERFATHLTAWEAAGVVRPWFRGSPDLGAAPEPDGHLRWRGAPTMRDLAAHLVRGLEVSLGTVVTGLASREGSWEVETVQRTPGSPSRPDAVPATAPRHHLAADALVLTAPIPQALALLRSSGLDLPGTAREALRASTFDPCLTLLAVPRTPPALPDRGAIRIEDGTLAWISDHRRSGASSAPALTVHAAAGFSRDHLDTSEPVVMRRLVRAAEAVVHTDLDAVHLHRWRYASPTNAVGRPCELIDVAGAPLVLAGDGFLGGRIEGAALSGLAAADHLDAREDALAGG